MARLDSATITGLCAPVKHAIAFAFPALIIAADLCGDGALWFVAPAFLIAFVGFDATLGRALERPSTFIFPIAYRALPWLYIPVQLGMIASGLAGAGSGSFLRLAALALATGTAGGVFGTLAAHEMIHSRHRGERLLGTAMLAGLTCLHFRLAHIRVHHRLAATPHDPATARRGEHVYRFIPRSLAGQWTMAWHSEARRTAQRGATMLDNRAMRYIAATMAIYAGIATALGTRAFVFQLVQSAVAILILELFNYVAHYGLERRALPGGGFEPFGPGHAWNTGQRFNNWALFNGGHHSDHHVSPARSYHELGSISATPQLPYGYAGTMLLALVPPLWRRSMEPRLAALQLPADQFPAG